MLQRFVDKHTQGNGISVFVFCHFAFVWLCEHLQCLHHIIYSKYYVYVLPRTFFVLHVLHMDSHAIYVSCTLFVAVCAV